MTTAQHDAYVLQIILLQFAHHILTRLVVSLISLQAKERAAMREQQERQRQEWITRQKEADENRQRAEDQLRGPGPSVQVTRGGMQEQRIIEATFF